MNLYKKASNRFLNGADLKISAMALIYASYFWLPAIPVQRKNDSQAKALSGPARDLTIQGSSAKSSSADALKSSSASVKSKTLYGRADQLELPYQTPAYLMPPLWKMKDEDPLPDYIVKWYIEPLDWVKIPKEFAGVWETRIAYTIPPRELSLLSDTAEKISFIEHVPEFKGNPSSLRSFHTDQYTFIRGMQVDEEGNIWDCPSLRNIELHKAVSENAGVKSYWSFVISDRKTKIVSERELLETLTIDRNYGFGNDVLEQQEVTRLSMSDSQVDAFFPKATELLAYTGQFNPLASVFTILSIYRPEYKIAAFEPIDNWRGIDLKSSFNEFRRRKRLEINEPLVSNNTSSDFAASGTSASSIDSTVTSSKCDQRGWLQLLRPRTVILPFDGVPGIYTVK